MYKLFQRGVQVGNLWEKELSSCKSIQFYSTQLTNDGLGVVNLVVLIRCLLYIYIYIYIYLKTLSI